MDILLNLLDYIDQWYEQFDSNEKAAAEMSKLREQLKWEKNIRENIHPDFIDNENTEKNDNYFVALLEQLKEYYPILSAPTPGFLASSTVAVSGAGSTVFQIKDIINISDSIEYEKEINKINSSLIEKEEIDRINEKIINIKQLLQSIDQQIVKEFEESISQYYLSHDQEDRNYIIGIAMRIVIEHLKGKLWVLAKKPKEQKCNLELILSRLKGPNIYLDKSGINTIINIYKDLHCKLSNIAKKNKITGLNMKILFNQYINLIYSLLFYTKTNGNQFNIT